MKNTFKKSERLNSKKNIKELFEKGSSFYLYPFKVFYLDSEDGESHQFLVSVPKRNLKSAVDRNKIKRKTREAYRLNKGSISSTTSLLIGLVYTKTRILPYSEIETSLKSIIIKFNSLDF